MVAEVGVALPLDRALGDPLDDRRRVLDPHLLRALVVLGAADAPGVQHEDLERVLREQLEEAVALLLVRIGKNGFVPGHAQELAGLVGSAGRRARGLAEHEEGRCLRPFELGDGRDDVLVAVQDQQEVRPSISSAEAASITSNGKVARPFLVYEVSKKSSLVAVLRDVLEVRVRLRDGAVDRRLVLGVEAEGLGEAAVLGGVDPAVRHPGDEVVLHRLGVVLPREGGRRLAGPGEADDQPTRLPLLGRDDLAAGVQRESAAVVDELVPHPQPALLRLPEVVGVEDPRHAVLEVDGDQSIVGVALGLEVGRVDDGQLRLELLVVGRREVELLLHTRDVRVGVLDVEPGGGAELGVVADVAVDHDHLLPGDVRVLPLRPSARPPRG